MRCLALLALLCCALLCFASIPLSGHVGRRSNSAIAEFTMCDAMQQHGTPRPLCVTGKGITSCLVHANCKVTQMADAKKSCYRLCSTVHHMADARETSCPPSKHSNVITHFVHQNCAYRICIESARKPCKQREPSFLVLQGLVRKS